MGRLMGFSHSIPRKAESKPLGGLGSRKPQGQKSRTLFTSVLPLELPHVNSKPRNTLTWSADFEKLSDLTNSSNHLTREGKII